MASGGTRARSVGVDHSAHAVKVATAHRVKPGDDDGELIPPLRPPDGYEVVTF
jgi:hypothetical protein